MSKAHLTAISRSKPSLPMQWLARQNLIQGEALDYGCGKGFDAKHFGMDRYDPHYTDDRIVIAKTEYKTSLAYNNSSYDTITCNYVMNVIESEKQRDLVIEQLKLLLAVGGKAYISVRRDRHVKEGYTSKGTYQSAVELDLPVVHEAKGKYIIYLLEK